MTTPAPTITPWPGDQPPSEAELEALLQREGLSGRWWSNPPGDRLDIPPGATHSAIVGPQGVACVEAARP